IILVPVVPLEGPVTPGAIPFDLPEEYKQKGFRLVPEKVRYPNQELHDTIHHEIFQDQTLMGFMFWPLIGGASMFVIGLAFGIPRAQKARGMQKYGRRTKGRELVPAAAFNRRNRSDGIGFQTNERRTLREFLLGREGSMVRIPQDKESSHVM